MTIIQTMWRDLEALRVADQPGWLSQRISTAACVAVYAAVSGETALPGLLIETLASAVPSLTEYPAGKGFTVRAVNLLPGRDGTVRLELSLADPAYRDIFAILVDDVVDAVTRAVTASGAVQSFTARLRVWQEFMQRRGREGLSREEQIGLMSELYVLESVLMPVLSAFVAVSAWRGPYNALHDFALSSCHIEVKGTTFLPPVSFVVSRLTQLDETLSDPLFMAHCSWNGASLTGISLPEAVDSLRNRLAGCDPSALSVFRDSLLQAGYLDFHAAIYKAPLYELVGVAYFRVREGFPRLRLRDMPSGVIDAAYTVDLGACTPFASTVSAMQNLAGSANR